MKRFLIISLLILPTMAFGQAAPLVPVNNELKLSVTLPEAETIWMALRKLPVEQVEQLMAKMRQQVSEQTQPKFGVPTPQSNNSVEQK